MSNRIVTGDETWVSHITLKSKQQLMQWRQRQSFAKDKAKQTLSSHIIMAIVFWDRHGVLLVEFMPQEQTINVEAYHETLQKLRRARQKLTRHFDKRSLPTPRQRQTAHCCSDPGRGRLIWMGFN